MMTLISKLLALTPDSPPPPVRVVLEVAPWLYLTLLFLGSSIAGGARMLWSYDPKKQAGKLWPWWRWLGACVSCGIIGLIAALWLYEDFHGNLFKVAAVSLLLGLGGSTTLDIALAVIRNRFVLQQKGDDANV